MILICSQPPPPPPFLLYSTPQAVHTMTLGGLYPSTLHQSSLVGVKDVDYHLQLIFQNFHFMYYNVYTCMYRPGGPARACWGHSEAGQAGCVDFSGSSPPDYYCERMGEFIIRYIVAFLSVISTDWLAVDWRNDNLYFSHPDSPNNLEFKDISSYTCMPPPLPCQAGSLYYDLTVDSAASPL